mgnify:CR=1 FL=1
MKFIENDILYYEGEHVVNIIVNMIEKYVYAPKESYETDNDYIRFYDLGKGMEFQVPSGYKLINTIYMNKNQLLYTLVNEVPVIVEDNAMKDEVVLGKPYLNDGMKLTKYKRISQA